LQRAAMNINISSNNLGPGFALAAGILILVMPQFLSLFVAIYLIVIGIVGLIAKV